MKNLEIKDILIYIICLIAIIVSVIANQNIIIKSKYIVKSSKLPKEFDGFKILHLSDLHSKMFGENNNRLIKKIDEENPNIIIMTGDMISRKDKNYSTFLKLAENIALKYPIYYITGNHEEDLPKDNLRYLFDELDKIGVKVLYNQKDVITLNEKSINLYGLCFQGQEYKLNTQITNNMIEKLIGKINKNEYNILLTHNALYFEECEKWGADLIFSGHVHGGIIRLPFVGGILSPETKFFPKYSKGKYVVNNTILVVSAGLGKSKIPRLFNYPDLPVIILYSE